MKNGISIFLNKTSPQILVLALGALFRGNEGKF